MLGSGNEQGHGRGGTSDLENELLYFAVHDLLSSLVHSEQCRALVGMTPVQIKHSLFSFQPPIPSNTNLLRAVRWEGMYKCFNIAKS